MTNEQVWIRNYPMPTGDMKQEQWLAEVAKFWSALCAFRQENQR